MDSHGVKDVLYRFIAGSIVTTRRLRLVSKWFWESIPMPPLLLNGIPVDFEKVRMILNNRAAFHISCGEWRVNHHCVAYKSMDLPAVVSWRREVFEEIFDELLPQLELYYIVDVPRKDYWKSSLMLSGEYWGQLAVKSATLQVVGGTARLFDQGCRAKIEISPQGFHLNRCGILVNCATYMWTGDFDDLLVFAKYCSGVQVVRRWGAL